MRAPALPGVLSGGWRRRGLCSECRWGSRIRRSPRRGCRERGAKLAPRKTKPGSPAEAPAAGCLSVGEATTLVGIPAPLNKAGFFPPVSVLRRPSQFIPEPENSLQRVPPGEAWVLSSLLCQVLGGYYWGTMDGAERQASEIILYLARDGAADLGCPALSANPLLTRPLDPGSANAYLSVLRAASGGQFILFPWPPPVAKTEDSGPGKGPHPILGLLGGLTRLESEGLDSGFGGNGKTPQCGTEGTLSPVPLAHSLSPWLAFAFSLLLLLFSLPGQEI